MKKTHIIIIFLTAVTFSLNAFATDCGKGKHLKSSGPKSYQMYFPDMDTDGNSALSWDEYQAKFPKSTKKMFDTLDTDKNGSLSHEEWRSFKEMHKGMKGGHHGNIHKGKKFHTTDMPDPAKYNAHFPNMDKDSDDLITLDEFKAYFPDGEEKVFKAIDLDQGGTLNHEEWHEFKEAHGLKHIN